MLFTTVGRARLPERFVSGLDPEGEFSHTEYTFPRLIEVCEQLVRQAVERSGGRIERDAEGQEVLVIPVRTPVPSELERSWDPGPIAGNRFTAEEMQQITAAGRAAQWQAQLEEILPGWTLRFCGPDMDPGPRTEYRGRRNVFMTHPLNRDVGAVLSRTVDVPADGHTDLRIVVANDHRVDWTLLVRADGWSWEAGYWAEIALETREL